MKRTFILLMSAAALIVVLAVLAYGWGASTATTWDNGWQAHNSSNFQATSTSAYDRVKAPYYADGCGARQAIIYRSNGQYVTTSACTGGSECCKILEWNADIGTSYYVQAYQNRLDPHGCGPTSATVSSSLLTCSGSGPQGE
jgi:hypothetical protein